MKILIASDSFKGSASSLEVADSISAGMKSLRPDLEVLRLPVADGGEGTSEVLVETLGAKRVSVNVHDPLGREIRADYTLRGNLAVIDMAGASGLVLLSTDELDPYKASTYGTGEMILDAVSKGATEIYIGLGGSATNDGGIGMAQALGVRALTEAGTNIGPGAAGLAELHSLDLSGLDSRLKKLKFYAVCDVTNPLSGPDGAAYVYARQKGAKADQLADLDRILQRYGQILEQSSGRKVVDLSGAGAAGGMGAALFAFLGAEAKNGINTVLDLLSFDEHAEGADLLITGEGKMDNSSLSGKTAIGIARRAKKLGIPLIAVVGSCELNLDSVYTEGIDFVLPIVNGPMSLEKALENVGPLLFESGKRIVRILELCNRRAR